MEAVSRSLNSSSSKSTVSFTASGAVRYAAVLRLLVGYSVDSGSGREFRMGNGLKAGIELDEVPYESRTRPKLRALRKGSKDGVGDNIPV